MGEETLEHPLEVIRAPGYVVPEAENEGPNWEEIEELVRER